jgi:hypothetical protein
MASRADSWARMPSPSSSRVAATRRAAVVRWMPNNAPMIDGKISPSAAERADNHRDGTAMNPDKLSTTELRETRDRWWDESFTA